MNDFNPIRDLRSPEADPFNVPAGQSTQEVGYRDSDLY